MVSKKIIVKEKNGLHFRPAGALSEEAIKYNCEITFKVRETTGNMKSFLGILAANIKSGEEIEIICEGSEEEAALCNIEKLLCN